MTANLRRGPQLLTVAIAVALLAAVVGVAGASGSELPALSAGLLAMVVGWIGGLFAAVVLLQGSPAVRPAPKFDPFAAFGTLLLALGVILAFGLGCCWVGLGVGALVHR
jgi:hypothetical protein